MSDVFSKKLFFILLSCSCTIANDITTNLRLAVHNEEENVCVYLF